MSSFNWEKLYGSRWMATIHMGRKLSAAEYWERGSGDFIQKKPNKYTCRYQNYLMPGYRGGFKNKIARRFMEDSKNYTFQWGSLNQHYGSGGIRFTTVPPGKKWKKSVCTSPTVSLFSTLGY